MQHCVMFFENTAVTLIKSLPLTFFPLQLKNCIENLSYHASPMLENNTQFIITSFHIKIQILPVEEQQSS